MNYGERLTKLKDSTGEKYWSKYGDLIGVSGEWLAEQSKKESIQTIDVTRLKKIINYHQKLGHVYVTLDYLLMDEVDNATNTNIELQDDDISKMINDIQKQLCEDEVKFNACIMGNECKEITKDMLEVVVELIKNNM